MTVARRPKAELVLSSEERSELEQLVRRHSTPSSMMLRAKIVLKCADGTSVREADFAATLIPPVSRTKLAQASRV